MCPDFGGFSDEPAPRVETAMNDHRSGHCDDAVASMYLFLDQELSPEQSDVVRAHLDECLPCLEAFEFEVEVRQIIASKCRDDVPTEVRFRILDSLQCEMAKNSGDGGIPAS